jgi:hypothetical protein
VLSVDTLRLYLCEKPCRSNIRSGISVDVLRRFYARLVVPDKDNTRLSARSLRSRESDSSAPDSWQVITASGDIDTPSDDPAFLYQDVSWRSRRSGGNNGQPSLHATGLAAANVSLGRNRPAQSGPAAVSRTAEPLPD